jgi:hypothetical protein
MKYVMILLAFLVADRFSGGEVRVVSWQVAQQKAWAMNAKMDGWFSVPETISGGWDGAPCQGRAVPGMVRRLLRRHGAFHLHPLKWAVYLTYVYFCLCDSSRSVR